MGCVLDPGKRQASGMQVTLRRQACEPASEAPCFGNERNEMEKRTWKTYALGAATFIGGVIMGRASGEAIRDLFGEPVEIGVAWAIVVLFLGWRLTDD